MDNEITNADIAARLDKLTAQVEVATRTVDKLRKYFLWTLIITLVTLVLPMIGLFFAIPAYVKTLGGADLGL